MPNEDLPTRRQTRLRTCWETLQNRFGEDPVKWPNEPSAAKYLTSLKQTASSIHNAGLPMALMFLASRNDSTCGKVYEDLSQTTCAVLGFFQTPTFQDLLRSADLPVISLLTSECEETASVFAWYLEGAGVTASTDETT